MIPASIRNNNPGAIYPGRSARKFGGRSSENLVSADGRHPIVQFPTAVHGAAAMFDNLMNARGVTGYYYRGRPLSTAIATWCGSIRATAYLALIKQHTGLEPSTVLTVDFLQDHEQAIALAKAMARHEAGKEYPLDQMDWLEAHAMAFSGGHVAPAPTPNNDVPTMRPEARWAATVMRVRNGLGLLTLTGGAASSPLWVPPVPPSITESIVNLGAWKQALVQLGTLSNEAVISGTAGVTVAGAAYAAARKWMVR